MGAVAAIVSVPYWVNFFEFRSWSAAADVTKRIGIDYGRYVHLWAPFPLIFDYLFYAAVAGIVYWLFYRQGEHKTACLYWIFLAAMAVVWNVQLVTGYVPHPDHWFRTVSPFLFVVLFHSLYRILSCYRHTLPVLVVLIGLLVSKKIVNINHFIEPRPDVLAAYTFDRNVMDTWPWITRNIEGEPGIVSSSFYTSLHLNNETSARPYLATSFNTLVANEILEERFLKTSRAFGLSSEVVSRMFRGDPQEACLWGSCVGNKYAVGNFVDTAGNLYGNYYRDDPGRNSRSFYKDMPEEQAVKLLDDYGKLRTDWHDLESDYVYYGPWEKQFSHLDLSRESQLRLVYKNPDVAILAISRK